MGLITHTVYFYFNFVVSELGLYWKSCLQAYLQKKNGKKHFWKLSNCKVGQILTFMMAIIVILVGKEREGGAGLLLPTFCCVWDSSLAINAPPLVGLKNSALLFTAVLLLREVKTFLNK